MKGYSPQMEHKAPISQRDLWRWIVTSFAALSGVCLFQFYGNVVKGYIDTDSLFYWWSYQWFNEASQTEHGPLILIISGFLFWNNLKQLSNSPDSPMLKTGTGFVLAALALHLLGTVAQQTRISIVAFLVFLYGLSLITGGKRWGRAALFPLAFLLFSIPMEFLFDEFGFYLRLTIIRAATVLAQLADIEVVRNGTQLSSPDGLFQYDVAPACSGIRSLVAIIALTTLLGYLSFKTWWKRGTLLVLSIPFAFIGNIIRVGTVILAAQAGGEAFGLAVHDYFGIIVFIVVVSLALATVTLINRISPEPEKMERFRDQSPSRSAPKIVKSQALATMAIIIFSTIVSAATSQRMNQSVQLDMTGVRLTKDQTDPVPFPSLLGLEWGGRRVPVSQLERETLPPDTGYSRIRYQSLDAPNQSVLMSIVLSGKDRGSIHRPELCLVGQGWTIQSKFIHEFALANEPLKLRATVLRIVRKTQSSDGKEQTTPGLFVYWFVGHQRLAATTPERIFYMIYDQFVHFKKHRWAYVFATTECPDGEEAGLNRIENVLRASLPNFQTANISTQAPNVTDEFQGTQKIK